MSVKLEASVMQRASFSGEVTSKCYVKLEKPGVVGIMRPKVYFFQ